MKLENNEYYLIKNALFGTDDYFVRQYNAEKHAFRWYFCVWQS